MASHVFDKINDLKEDLSQVSQLLLHEKHRLALLKAANPQDQVQIQQCKERIESYTLEVIRIRSQLIFLDDH